MTPVLIFHEDVMRSTKDVVFIPGEPEAGSCCGMLGAFASNVPVAVTVAPQLPQKAVPASNCVPHFVQNAIESLLAVYGPGCS